MAVGSCKCRDESGLDSREFVCPKFMTLFIRPGSLCIENGQKLVAYDTCCRSSDCQLSTQDGEALELNLLLSPSYKLC